VHFSIVTPSFRQPDWLRLCLSSVADQALEVDARGQPARAVRAVSVEHVVQDACSGNEVRAVCAEFPSVGLFQEEDGGMYDAVNRGLRRTTGDICAYLNCDEQYLPGTLLAVADYFTRHPDIDVVFGDVVVVNEAGRYTCSRQVLRPWYYHTQICQLNTLTAATFFRRKILEHEDLYFNPKWTSPGDAAWVLALLRRKVRMGIIKKYLSAFVDSGTNMNLTAVSRQEIRALRMSAPRWARTLSPVWVAVHRVRRLLNGHYLLRPFSYDIFTRLTPSHRVHFEVIQPTFEWRTRRRVKM
jgi:glycosyltransferase involved in cell wall biosynthesis